MSTTSDAEAAYHASMPWNKSLLTRLRHWGRADKPNRPVHRQDPYRAMREAADALDRLERQVAAAYRLAARWEATAGKETPRDAYTGKDSGMTRDHSLHGETLREKLDAAALESEAP